MLGASQQRCVPAVRMSNQHLQSFLGLSEAAATTLLKPVLLIPLGASGSWMGPLFSAFGL